MEQPPWPAWLTADNAATLVGGSVLTWFVLNAKKIYETISGVVALLKATWRTLSKAIQFYQDIEELVDMKKSLETDLAALKLKVKEVDQLRELVLILFEALDIDVENPYDAPTDISELTDEESELIRLLRERKETDDASS